MLPSRLRPEKPVLNAPDASLSRVVSRPSTRSGDPDDGGARTTGGHPLSTGVIHELSDDGIPAVSPPARLAPPRRHPGRPHRHGGGRVRRGGQRLGGSLPELALPGAY